MMTSQATRGSKAGGSCRGGGVEGSYHWHFNGMDFGEGEVRAGLGHLRVWCHNLDASGEEYGLAEKVKMWPKYEVDVILIQNFRLKSAALATTLRMITKV